MDFWAFRYIPLSADGVIMFRLNVFRWRSDSVNRNSVLGNLRAVYKNLGVSLFSTPYISWHDTVFEVVMYSLLPVTVAARSNVWVFGRSPAEIMGSNPTGGMDVCCECCVLSSRGLCDGLIIRPEESYRLWRVVACDQETSNTRRLKFTTGLWKIQPQWDVTPGKQTKNVYSYWT